MLKLIERPVRTRQTLTHTAIFSKKPEKTDGVWTFSNVKNNLAFSWGIRLTVFRIGRRLTNSTQQE